MPISSARCIGQPGSVNSGGTWQVAAGNAYNPANTVIPIALYYNDNQGGAPGLLDGGADGF